MASNPRLPLFPPTGAAAAAVVRPSRPRSPGQGGWWRMGGCPGSAFTHSLPRAVTSCWSQHIFFSLFFSFFAHSVTSVTILFFLFFRSVFFFFSCPLVTSSGRYYFSSLFRLFEFPFLIDVSSCLLVVLFCYLFSVVVTW